MSIFEDFLLVFDITPNKQLINYKKHFFFSLQTELQKESSSREFWTMTMLFAWFNTHL